MTFPAVQQQADRSSAQAQRRFLLATAVVLASITAAAILGVVNGRWAGWVGAGAFLGALVISGLAVTQNLERTWYDGRALAESSKSLSWLYATRGGEFGTAPRPEKELRDRLAKLRAELADLDFVVEADGKEITDAMLELRNAPLAVRRAAYLEQRVADQACYYRTRGREHQRQARLFRAGTWAAQTAGFVGAVLKGTGIIDVDLLGIGAAAAASITAWLQTRDHVTLARAYRLTAEDLGRVRDDVPADDDEQEWAAYVADAEAAMSREHVMWLARRGRRVD
jgi:hypothetical protein